MLNRRNIDHVLAHGKIGKKEREGMMERIKSAKLTVGTTSLLGEGIDVSSWNTLIMGAPISSEIKLMQAIGRIVRPSNGKEKAIVYDLKDNCGFAGASFNKRFEIYKKNKIWVQFQK
jgi:superfamily II DNA or RNA helicase